MGLSSKQVSGEHELEWAQSLLGSDSLELSKPKQSRRQQQQQQPPEQLKCPRCESTNTKFCYYNNYNKSQPRHFCKACKRHWTKGGTLRNVPVGGVRKNKRPKRPSSASTSNPAAATTTAATTYNFPIGLQTPDVNAYDSKAFGNEGLGSQDLYTTHAQGLNGPTWDLSFMSSALNQSIGFSLFSSALDTNTAPIPTYFPPLNGYSKSIEKLESTTEDSTVTTIMPSCSSNIVTQPWQAPSTSNFMDMPSTWNWNDLNMTWDIDSEFKP